MLAKLKAKSQITLPKKIIESLGLSKGDKFEVYEKDGVICLTPVAVYPKKYVAELRREIDGIKSDIDSGKKPVFDSLDSLFEKPENEI